MWTSFYIGIAGYGGGPAIIGYMHELFVTRKKWVEENDFHIGLSLSQLLPGATAFSMIVFLAFRLRGALGALLAPLCFIGPAIVSMTILSALYFAYGQAPLVGALLTGLGAAVAALLVYATVTLGRSAVKGVWELLGAALAFLALYLAHLPILALIAIGAAAGLIFYGRQPLVRAPADTASPTAAPRWLWWAWGIAVAVPILLLAITAGSPATKMILALLRVGALTFGGGYMAIPLFQHEAVITHPWLTARQFVDGIALGQITPGPVLITAAFIGYRVFGVLGALLGSVAIFSPGGLAMFLLASRHEQVQHLRWMQAMVRGVLVAYIGLLVSVTVRVAMQSVTDWKTLAIAVAGIVVLLIARKDPIWVILGAAIISPFLFSY